MHSARVAASLAVCVIACMPIRADDKARSQGQRELSRQHRRDAADACCGTRLRNGRPNAGNLERVRALLDKGADVEVRGQPNIKLWLRDALSASVAHQRD